AGHLPQREGFYRVPNMICGRIITPSLLGKVDFALQEAKDGRVDSTLMSEKNHKKSPTLLRGSVF
ncbi:MAG TPA: hypothetical protein VLZ54_00180, partial [Arenibacter sp.]|nr:hypothetical protein [Arenibacter sp.]